MASDRRRLLVLVLSIGGVGVLAYWALPRMLKAAAGPENEIIAAIKGTEQEGLSLDIPGCSDRLISSRHSFDRITVNLDPARRAHAVSTLDFNGKFGEIYVSSLGYERISFEDIAGSWKPVEGYAPQLAEVVATLEARRKASATHTHERTTAWFIRLDRDEILVTEQYESEGVSTNQASAQIPMRRLRLERRSGKLFFPEGPM